MFDFLVACAYDTILQPQEHDMPPSSQAALAESNTDLKSAVLRSEPSNPALQRLKLRVVARTEPSAVITSYDRMHHRHSRS